MSYEYNIISNASTAVLHEKIIYLLNEFSEYRLIESCENGSSFKRRSSVSEWGSDIDLTISDDGILFQINCGNTGLIECLAKSLEKFGINTVFQEL